MVLTYTELLIHLKVGVYTNERFQRKMYHLMTRYMEPEMLQSYQEGGFMRPKCVLWVEKEVAKKFPTTSHPPC